MVAPQHPTDAEPWTAPPPGSVVTPPPRRWRTPVLAAAAVLAAAVVAVTAWALLRDTADPAANDPAGGESEQVGDGPAERPEATEEDPDVGEDVDPELARLRTTDRYLAFAEHDRATDVEWPGEMDGAWAIFQARGYAESEALWDEVVRPIRDDALLAGEPFTEAIWNEEYPTAAYIPVGWDDAMTGGRGDAFVFAVRFVEPTTGEPVERIQAVLILPNVDGRGEIAARMDPFDLRRRDARGFLEAGTLVDERVWEWVQHQPPAQSG